MAIEVKLPDLGEGIESGDVLEVLVKEGDTIRKDQGLVELETDKATVEVPSSHGGKVVKVHVSEGQSINVGQLLVTLEESATAETKQPAAKPAPEAKAEPAPSPPDAKPTADKKPAAPAAKEDSETKADDDEQPAPAKRPTKKAEPAPAAPAAQPKAAAVQTAPAGDEASVAAGPAVRRFAREVGVDLTQVQGSGPGGRITRDDVLQVVRQANQVVRNGGQAADQATERDDWGPVQYERLTKIRKTIANKMFESWSTVPRVTNFDDADVTELERIRQSSKKDYADKGIKLTSMPFVIKAVAMAMSTNPAINASLDMENERIVYKKYVNIGIAVDTDRGLVVPALRNADQLSIAQIAKRLADLAERVRKNEFSIEDLRGGTFTISNLGAIGGTYSTPIINVPEVAILLVGRSRKMPIVLDDEVAVRLMMPLSISYDHRLVDGATAARFLNDVIGFLEAPSRLLLAP